MTFFKDDVLSITFKSNIFTSKFYIKDLIESRHFWTRHLKTFKSLLNSRNIPPMDSPVFEP